MHFSLRAIPAALVCLACALAGCSAPRGAGRGEAVPPYEPFRLRVLTYNIHHGEGTDGRIDLERIARVITDQRPDLVAVQEVDVKTRRNGGVDQAAELARLTGLRVAFGKARDFEGGDYGQAILSRFPILSFHTHTLPGDPESEQRIALEAHVKPRDFNVPHLAWERGPIIRFVGTHLHHLPPEANRLRQAAELNRLFAGEGETQPTILAGDLNAEPGSGTMDLLTRRWVDAASQNQELGPRLNTYPANAPRKRIDYVLLRPGGAWRVIESRVIPETVASDHSPVLAVVEWVPQQ